MRTGILSKLEKQMLQEYLEKGIKRENFRMLMHRIRKNIKRIREEYELILAVVEHEAKKK